MPKTAIFLIQLDFFRTFLWPIQHQIVFKSQYPDWRLVFFLQISIDILERWVANREMLYHISLSELNACIKRYWTNENFKPIGRDGLLPTNPAWSFDKGRARFEIDCVRIGNFSVNGEAIRSIAEFEQLIQQLVENHQCHERFLEEFLRYYDQDAIDPIRIYMMLCLGDELRQAELAPVNYHSKRSVALNITALEARLVITLEDYTYQSVEGHKLLIPGRSQTHVMVTPYGFQVLGIMTTNPLLYDLFTSLTVINKKEFYKRIEKETIKETRQNWVTTDTLIKELNGLYNKAPRKFKNFAFACNRLLKLKLDDFWLELLDQLINQIGKMGIYFPTFFTSDKNKLDVEKDAMALIDAPKDYLNESIIYAKQSDRNALINMLEPMIAKADKDKPIYETLRCMSLYLKSYHLTHDALILFAEFMLASSKEPKLCEFVNSLEPDVQTPAKKETPLRMNFLSD